MSYIDGFVLCVPEEKLKEYKKMAAKAGKVWIRHGALQYVEAAGDDMKGNEFCMTFPALAQPKKGEIVMFSFIIYKSRKHRDSVNKKVMAEMMKDGGDPEKCMEIFDVKRMAYGGFKALVAL